MNIKTFMIAIFVINIASMHIIQPMNTNHSNKPFPSDQLQTLQARYPRFLEVLNISSLKKNEEEIVYRVSGFTQDGIHETITLSKEKESDQLYAFFGAGVRNGHATDVVNSPESFVIDQSITANYWHECHEFCQWTENKRSNS